MHVASVTIAKQLCVTSMSPVNSSAKLLENVCLLSTRDVAFDLAVLLKSKPTPFHARVVYEVNISKTAWMTYIDAIFLEQYKANYFSHPQTIVVSHTYQTYFQIESNTKWLMLTSLFGIANLA